MGNKGRFGAGGGTGIIVDGVINLKDGKYVLIDEDGEEFDIYDEFNDLNGLRVRLTLISFESLDKIEKHLMTQNDYSELPEGHTPVMDRVLKS
jgi:hypothetical protein